MSAIVAIEASTVPWSALFSWVVAGTCSALAFRKRRSVADLAPPPAKQLFRELEVEPASALDSVSRGLAVAELNQRLSDVSFELEVMPSTFAALIRICLASGSGLALLSFLAASELALALRLTWLTISAAAGLCGAAMVAALGRSAKAVGREIREKWDASSRDIGKALGVSLESAESPVNSR